MQVKINLSKNYPSLEEAAALAREKITKHRKAIQDLEEEMKAKIRPHQARIRTLNNSLSFFEKKIKAGEPWVGEGGAE